jgi:hypothetical protein
VEFSRIKTGGDKRMAISDKEFYAAHGIDYNPAKWLQDYTDYILVKTLEDVKNEIELESHDQKYCPYPNSFLVGLKVAIGIIDKHILDLTSEVAANEKVSEESREEPSKDV